jgi:hypothetical protein
MSDIHIQPSNTVAPAGSQSFETRFLRREAGGEALGVVFEFLTISDFFRRVQAPSKPLAVPSQGLLDARRFYNIDPSSDDHLFGCPLCPMQVEKPQGPD